MKAVIPAAGRGTRMLPLTRARPKELLPLGRKPVLQHIVEELQQAALDEIIIVTSPAKLAIAAHFAGVDGIRFVEQPEPLGVGHAILMAQETVGEAAFVAALADAPIVGPAAGALVPSLIRAHSEGSAAAVLAVQPIARADSGKRGVVTTVAVPAAHAPARVRDIVEKPASPDTQSVWALACRYVFSPAIFAALQQAAPDADGEIQLTDGIRALIRSDQTVLALALAEGQARHDTGNFEDYFRAVVAFSE